MAFKASKKRERKAPDPVGRGTQIIPSAAIREWYKKQLDLILSAMERDYKDQLRDALKTPDVEAFFAQDGAAQSIFNRVLKKLNSFWEQTFEGFARKTAHEFVHKADEGATASTMFSLSTAGVKKPNAIYTENVSNILGAAVEFNHTLITNIQKEVHEKVFEAVMMSLTSPNPEEQGAAGIERAVIKAGIDGRKRVDLITRDQTSKLYSALSDQRMIDNGCEEFEWIHSSAGKEPRHSHELMNGHIFKFNDPVLWQTGGEFKLKKADLGPPGWAINCRCRKVPVFR